MNQLDDLESRLDTLTTKILVPLRTAKQIDQVALADLNQLVDDMIREIGDEPTISRALAGKLWFIFTHMLAEAGHTRSPEHILRGAWSFEGQLEKLFGPWFDHGPPTPPGTPRY
jgi:hypothetical protein